ncbi:PilN domain-containing protein [Thermodesulfobacteriota bacterium]
MTEAGGVSVALRGVCEAIDSKGSVCNSVVEDGHVSFRNLSMPFSDLKKIRQTLGFELETLMASSVEGQLIDFIDVGRSGTQTNLIAASVNRDYIWEHLAHFKSFEVEPEVLDIRNVSLVNQLMMQQNSPTNGMLLSLDSRICSILFFSDKKIILIRHLPFHGNGLADIASLAAKREKVELPDTGAYEAGLVSLSRSINLTLRGFHLETGADHKPQEVFITGPGTLVPVTAEILGKELELKVSNVNLSENADNIQLSQHLTGVYNPALMDNALALALREGKKAKGFNFRREQFQVKTQFVKIKKELIRASIYLGVICILLAVNFGVDYRDLKKRNASLDTQIKELFTRTFPEVTNVVEPMHQMKTKIKALKDESGVAPGIKNGLFLGILNDVSSRIPADLEIQVDRMVVDQQGVQIRGTTDTFNTVDSIKKGLESSDMYRDVIIASANLDQSGKGVRFEIKMDRTP